MVKNTDMFNTGFLGLILPNADTKPDPGLQNFSLGYALPNAAWNAPMDNFKSQIMDVLKNDPSFITTADDIPNEAEPERIHLVNSLVTPKTSGCS